jgi:hypothetical protein
VSWTITVPIAPLSLNAELKGHWSVRSAHVAQCRESAMWLAKEARIPPMQRVSVTATELRTPTAKGADRKGRRDLGNFYWTVKGSIDGLVDAGVIADDDETHLVRLTFLPSRRVEQASEAGMELVVEEDR